MKKGDVGMAQCLKSTETRDELSTTCNPKIMSRCLSAPDATSLHHCLQNHHQYFNILKELCHYKRRIVTKNRNPPFWWTSFSIYAPRTSSVYLARNSWAGEVESVPSSILRSLLILTLDWSNLQTFQRWKPYLDPVFNRTIPESSAPRLKQKKVRLGFIKS